MKHDSFYTLEEQLAIHQKGIFAFRKWKPTFPWHETIAQWEQFRTLLFANDPSISVSFSEDEKKLFFILHEPILKIMRQNENLENIEKAKLILLQEEQRKIDEQKEAEKEKNEEYYVDKLCNKIYERQINIEITPFSFLCGKRIKRIMHNGKIEDNMCTSDALLFICTDTDGMENRFLMYHQKDCCESVYLQSCAIEGQNTLKDFEGALIIEAFEVEHDNSERLKVFAGQNSVTWTFYKLTTDRGFITLRWFGSSNGYYSESVSFMQITEH